KLHAPPTGDGEDASMPRQQRFSIDRRALLSGSAALAAAAALPRLGHAQSPVKKFRLTAAPGRVALAGAGNPQTAVWSFNGQVPGPEIRVRQGERVRIAVTNDLPEETTVHWHGIRLPNAMDGVPH